MTEHEMRVRLAEAMGYHRCTKYRGSPSAPWMGPDGAYASTIPDPLESDADAARLRAYFVNRGWRFRITHKADERGTHVHCTFRLDDPIAFGGCTVFSDEDPDYSARERRATCVAAVRALTSLELV